MPLSCSKYLDEIRACASEQRALGNHETARLLWAVVDEINALQGVADEVGAFLAARSSAADGAGGARPVRPPRRGDG